jgi:hypothetical protein
MGSKTKNSRPEGELPTGPLASSLRRAGGGPVANSAPAVHHLQNRFLCSENLSHISGARNRSARSRARWKDRKLYRRAAVTGPARAPASMEMATIRGGEEAHLGVPRFRALRDRSSTPCAGERGCAAISRLREVPAQAWRGNPQFMHLYASRHFRREYSESMSKDVDLCCPWRGKDLRLGRLAQAPMSSRRAKASNAGVKLLIQAGLLCSGGRLHLVASHYTKL